MSNVLFINACVREDSRTLTLAEHILSEIEGNVTEIVLAEEDIRPLNRQSLELRDRLVRQGEDHPMLRYARQLAEADEIVIAAPYWDLSFPALLKVYLEQVTVAGITLRYEEGRPVGLCRAARLTYVTTSGGPIVEDFGYAYVKALAKNFYGIGETVCYRATMLDVMGVTSEELVSRVEITRIS